MAGLCQPFRTVNLRTIVHVTRHPQRPCHSRCMAMFTDGWPVWALLTSSASLAQVAATRTRIGSALSAPLLAMACGLGLSATGVLPVDCPAYNVVWAYLMPGAAAGYLLEADMSQLMRTGGPLLLAFLVGAVGMVMGAVAGLKLCQGLGLLGPHGPQLAACLCASYVGGSVNFAAVAQAVGLPAALVPAAMAADNIAMAVFLALLMVYPEGSSAGHNSVQDGTAASASRTTLPGPVRPPALPPAPSVTPESLALSLGAAACACSCGHALAHALAVPSLHLLAMTLVAACIAALAPKLLPGHPSPGCSRCPAPVLTAAGEGGGMVASEPSTAMAGPPPMPAAAPMGSVDAAAVTTAVLVPGSCISGQQLAMAISPFAGASQLSGALMCVFFTVIGCSAGSLHCLARPEALAMLLLLLVMVAVHWGVLLAANTLMRLPAWALVLGSNANVGGPATAAAMANSRGWPAMAQTAMLTGSLGYAVGTAAGLAVAWVLKVPLRL
ncbi:hypothetical protein V8C86DRAFT_2458332 [Haematococcus lacustris]